MKKRNKIILISVSILLIIGAIFFRIFYVNKHPNWPNKPNPIPSTIIIENGNSVKLKSRDELDVYLINRYIEHLKLENDSAELKVVNDVLNSRYNMP